MISLEGTFLDFSKIRGFGPRPNLHPGIYPYACSYSFAALQGGDNVDITHLKIQTTKILSLTKALLGEDLFDAISPRSLTFSSYIWISMGTDVWQRETNEE